MTTVREIAAKLVGSTSYSGEQPSGLSPAARVRERARANYGKGKRMSMFSGGACGRVVNDGSIFDQQRHERALAALDERIDTTGFKEQNRSAHQSAQERNQDNRDRVDDFNESEEQGFDSVEEGEGYSAPTLAPVESAQRVEGEQQPQQPPPGKRFMNEVERRNYERLNYRAS